MPPSEQPQDRAGELTFEEFFESEHLRLFGTICLITGNRQEAEDVMQEAFLRVWERWGRVSQMESPAGYLYQCSMNIVRKRMRRSRLAARRFKSDPVGPEDAFSEVEARDAVIRLLAPLTPRQRAALVLTELRGLSSQEAARALRIAPGTVRVLKAQALKSLRSGGEGDG